MTGTTPAFAFRYPSLGDPPDGPTQIQNLATDVENKIVTMDSTIATNTANISTLTIRPRANIRQTAVQSIPNGAYTSISFQTEDYDTPSGHDPVTNNTRYTAPITGKYTFSGGVAFVANGSGLRGTRWAKNGTALNASASMFVTVGAGAASRITAQTIGVDLAAGDFVELQAFQDTGGAINTFATAENASFMHVLYEGV